MDVYFPRLLLNLTPIPFYRTRTNPSIHGNDNYSNKSSKFAAGNERLKLSSRNSLFYKWRSSTFARSMADISSIIADDALKLATFTTGATECQVGVVHCGHIWPLQQVVNLSLEIDAYNVNDMIDVINHWHLLRSCMKLEGSGIKVGDVKLLAPLPRSSGVIMCVGENYVDHVKESDTWKTAPGIAAPDIPKYPIIFTKAPQSIIGPGAAIQYPLGISTQVDYETELAVIIGKRGRGIKREDAFSHVFGYCSIKKLEVDLILEMIWLLVMKSPRVLMERMVEVKVDQF
eukprot:Gb_17736 [translate_table: standard]